MGFKERKTGSPEANHRYAEPERGLDARTVGLEEFDAQRERLIVRDGEGRWWTKVTRPTNVDTSTRAVRSMPPYYQPPPADGALDLRLQVEQTGSFPSGSRVWDERSPLSRPEQDKQAAPQAIPDSSSTRERNGDVADSAAPVLESEERFALHETKRLGE